MTTTAPFILTTPSNTNPPNDVINLEKTVAFAILASSLAASAFLASAAAAASSSFVVVGFTIPVAALCEAAVCSVDDVGDPPDKTVAVEVSGAACTTVKLIVQSNKNIIIRFILLLTISIPNIEFTPFRFYLCFLLYSSTLF